MDAQILTGPMLLGRELEYVREGHIVVEKGKVAECGEGREGGGRMCSVVPAFINGHTHAADFFLRGAFGGLPLRDVCARGGLKEEALNSAENELIFNSLKNALHEIMMSGTCCFADFREGGAAGARILREALSMYGGLRARILGRPANEDDEFLDVCDGYGARSVRADKIEMKPGKMTGIHVCEANSGELEDSLEFEPDFLVHMNSASESEIRNAGDLGIPVVVCPRSNKSFGLKAPDLGKMHEAGIFLCLGTDNAMTNTLNMAHEIAFAYEMNRRTTSAMEILRMATVNPAMVFGWNTGYIEKGCDANFIVLDKTFLANGNAHEKTVQRVSLLNFDVMLGGKYAGIC